MVKILQWLPKQQLWCDFVGKSLEDVREPAAWRLWLGKMENCGALAGVCAQLSALEAAVVMFYSTENIFSSKYMDQQ